MVATVLPDAESGADGANQGQYAVSLVRPSALSAKLIDAGNQGGAAAVTFGERTYVQAGEKLFLLSGSGDAKQLPEGLVLAADDNYFANFRTTRE